MDKRSLLFIISVTTSFLFIRSLYEKKNDSQPKNWQQTSQQIIPPTEESIIKPSSNETTALPVSYCALENEYQQIIFSSRGASISEINLPFKGKDHQRSVVLPIEVDRNLTENFPAHSQFPQVSAKLSDGSLLENSKGGYYPLLRREDKGQANNCLSLVSQYPEFSSLPFEVTSFTKNSITFVAKQPHRKITKTFSFPKDSHKFPYCLDVSITIDGSTKDIWITSGIPEVEWLAGNSGATLKYRIIRGTKGTVEKVDLPKTTFTNLSIRPDWICSSNGFFGIILDPLQGQGSGMSFSKIAGDQAPSRLLFFNEARDRYSAKDLPGFEARMPLNPNQKTTTLRLFAGPFSTSILTTIDANSIEQHAKPTNYLSCITFHGWFSFISEPFANFLFFIMRQLHSLFDSWALSIILATIVLRILLYPLNKWSLRSMKAMQEIAPLVKAIQEKHKKDPVKAQMEVMALYKEKKANPFSGCLPLLIQMPFLLGMFDLLKSTFELRGASFIPGWINDLSAPDILFEWSTSLPFIGDEFHLLPIILGATMYLQQIFSSNLPQNSQEWTDQQRQQKAMGVMMTVVMTFMFYNFPSGLNIYWISSMLLGILQQWWTTKSPKPS